MFGQRRARMGIAERDEYSLPDTADAYGNNIATKSDGYGKQQIVPFCLVKTRKIEHAAYVLFKKKLVKEHGHHNERTNLNEQSENKVAHPVVFNGQIVGYKPYNRQRNRHAKRE